jgi:hypothetical protein
MRSYYKGFRIDVTQCHARAVWHASVIGSPLRATASDDKGVVTSGVIGFVSDKAALNFAKQIVDTGYRAEQPFHFPVE